jgi:hypothetical protein
MDPGAFLATKFYSLAAFGFVPVAIKFRLFNLLCEKGEKTTSQSLTDSIIKTVAQSQDSIIPTVDLIEDALYALTSLGLLDYVDSDDGNTFSPNDITRYIIDTPSVIGGLDHFTTETLWASAFLMKKLDAERFRYPFTEDETAFQYGFEATGQPQYATRHMFETMAIQGRMPMFNIFMRGKFGIFARSMPDRIRSFGYDLDGLVVECKAGELFWVDIGGGLGEQLEELSVVYPCLKREQLVLQENQSSLPVSERFMCQHWDFKSSQGQPIFGARVYSFVNVLHNLSDELVIQVLRKISAVMEVGYSKLLVQGFSRNENYGGMHASMIVMLAGRTRSRKQWRKMAEECGLSVTFEAFPMLGEGLIEMVKS